MCYEPYIGEIMMWAGNYAPEGWAFCDGSLMRINQNPALFALLGTMYGGDGVSTFGLPNLQGRFPLGIRQNTQGTYYAPGDTGGAEKITVTPTLAVAPSTEGGGTTPQPTVNVVSTPPGDAFPSMPPYQAVTFVIAIQGIWPSRS